MRVSLAVGLLIIVAALVAVLLLYLVPSKSLLSSDDTPSIEVAGTPDGSARGAGLSSKAIDGQPRVIRRASNNGPHGPTETAPGAAALEDESADGESAESAAAVKLLAENAELAKMHVDSYCAEAKRLAGGKLAEPRRPTRNRDAWAYMNVRIDWEGGKRPQGLLHLPEPLRQNLKGYGADWFRRITDHDLQGLNFGWLSEISQFDHWSVLHDVANAREASLLSAPTPNFLELQSWTKLRLARAARAGDFEAASGEIRHL